LATWHGFNGQCCGHSLFLIGSVCSHQGKGHETDILVQLPWHPCLVHHCASNQLSSLNVIGAKSQINRSYMIEKIRSVPVRVKLTSVGTDLIYYSLQLI